MNKAEAVIKKVGDKYVIYSKDGKKLGEFSSKKEAEKRLRQIEYFKHSKGEGWSIFREVFEKRV